MKNSEKITFYFELFSLTVEDNIQLLKGKRQGQGMGKEEQTSVGMPQNMTPPEKEKDDYQKAAFQHKESTKPLVYYQHYAKCTSCL